MVGCCLLGLFRHVSRGTLTMAVQFVIPLFTSVPLLAMAEAPHWQLRGIVTNTAPAPIPWPSAVPRALYYLICSGVDDYQRTSTLSVARLQQALPGSPSPAMCIWHPTADH